MDSKKLVKRLIYLILFILIVNFFANEFSWYYLVWNLDMIMHFQGGIWAGLAIIYLFPPKAYSIDSVLKILLAVFFIGVGWEVFEILVNETIARNPFNSLDTMSDIFFDLSGGATAVLYFFKRIMHDSEIAV
ncbi:MAG TPA: hypothetical protein VK675_02365 [Candidatus Paceibacterota bacterium]|nr:hypothetical protein [Candidatus Paceibacterota bacterium]